MLKNKKFLILLILIIPLIITCGCGNKKITNDVSKTKDNMLNNLDNFSFSASITAQTSFVDITINLNCIQDNKNKMQYCKTSTLGIVDTEQYIDFNNKKSYRMTSTLLGGSEDDGKWITEDYKGSTTITDSWIGLNDYVDDLTVTDVNDGKLYKGKISSKKLSQAISKSDAKSSIKPISSNKDIPIEIFINKDGYIETTNTEMEFAGIKEIISIKYSNFNTAGNVVIPSSVTQ